MTDVIDGAAGAEVSMVTWNAVEAVPWLPAASVALAVSVWLPWLKHRRRDRVGATGRNAGAEHRRAIGVVDRDRAAGFCRAGDASVSYRS